MMEVYLGHFADNITVLSFRYVDLRDKTKRVIDEAVRGQSSQINVRNDQRIEVNSEQVDVVEEFGRCIFGQLKKAMKDIRQMLCKTSQAFSVRLAGRRKFGC